MIDVCKIDGSVGSKKLMLANYNLSSITSIVRFPLRNCFISNFFFYVIFFINFIRYEASGTNFLNPTYYFSHIFSLSHSFIQIFY